APRTRHELVVTGAAQLTLQRLRGLRREVEIERDRVGQFASAGTEHAHETGHAALVYGDRGNATTERDDALGTDCTASERDAGGIAAERVAGHAGADEREIRNRTGEGPDEREGHEVDRGHLETAGFDSLNQPEHGCLLHGREQDVHALLAAVTRARGPEDREVEHGVVERNRNELRGLELERAAELVARHERHLDLTNHDA